MNSLSPMNKTWCGLLLAGVCGLIASTAGCGGSNEGVAKGTATSNEPAAKSEKGESKRPKGEASKTEGAAGGPKMIGDIPYDVFFDKPLAVAANTQTGAAASTTVAANDASPPPPATDTPATMKDPPKEAGGTASAKDLIDKDSLTAEIKNVRNYLKGKTASVSTYNSSLLEIAPEAATLAVLAVAVSKALLTFARKQSEKRVKQDIEYLTRLWGEIQDKARTVSAPALVYEDLNAVLRSIRDWVNEEIDKIVVDSRYHFNDIQRFVSHFMPSLRQKVDLYQGDVPIFDSYNISSELARALERKVWLKSGGYIVIDQAEALVAIDVNTGRFVGKKNLEDTILKTNLEAVQEIAYQLRLRNCGGIIVLDLIDMEKEENKQRVYRALEEALRKDRARPSIQKISDLGLIEMTRKRTRDTMVRALCESCSHCEGKGFVKSRETVAYEVLRDVERDGIDQIGRAHV